MRVVETVLLYKTDYPDHLSSYVQQIKDAISQGKHHDHRRHLFTNYLRVAYGVDPGEVTIEEKVTAANVRGYIDALYKFIIFEFKTNLDAEREVAKLELKKYFEGQVDPTEYIALVSDGLRFEVYQYEAGKPTRISSFELLESDPLSSYRHLDNIIMATKKVTPKSIDITTRFGLESAVFNKLRVQLDGLFDLVKGESSAQIKYREWNSLLAKVYGEELGNPSLFIRHTYLTVLSRLMVAQALFPDGRRRKWDYKGILTGKFFAKKNLPNLAEPDFFSWALKTEAEEGFIGVMATLDSALSVFRLDNIGEDLMKEIYQELVDPESRHSLGEYYTPDWIADLALERIGYKGGTVLDPACGSGTFLLAAVRRLRANGFRGKALVEKVTNNVLGIDVHPLAVMMSKANVLLGLAKEIRRLKSDIYLPVYMADTLLVTEQEKTNCIEILVSEGDAFHIPLQTIEKGSVVDSLIDRLTRVCQGGFASDSDRSKAWKGLERTVFRDFTDDEQFFWKANFKLLSRLVAQGRDSIWGFILKNAYRPAFIRQQKVDYVVGNPPWLAYRYIKDKTYKARVKELTLKHKLLDSGQVKLFTQMDTSTLFFVYCQRHFLKDSGVIAFVLPKTTILPSKQHTAFQSMGVTEIHDFSGVSPLFNVRSVLVIRRQQGNRTQSIPVQVFEGRLPVKNMAWPTARKHMALSREHLDFLSTEVRGPYYYSRFLQGATIVPRCMWFIQPDPDAANHEKAPFFETSDEAYAGAKKEWKIRLEGQIEKELLYETILAKDIVPFAILGTEQLFLPLQKLKESTALADYTRLLELGYDHAAQWMKAAEEFWEERRQSPDRSLVQWLNYNQKLVRQNVTAPMVVLYNTSGTHLAAALCTRGDNGSMKPESNGFLAESVTYYYYPLSLDEGDYLTAILNSKIVNEIIKVFQPQGLFGERHIHRRPFEACAIPRFNAQDDIHGEIATLGMECRREMAPYVSQLHGRIGALRTEVRRVLKSQIAKINGHVKELLRAQGQDKFLLKKRKKHKGARDLFESE